MTACMGGWCSKRSKCPHYHAGQLDGATNDPEQRLCLPGRDGVRLSQFGPVAVAIPVSVFYSKNEKARV